MTANWLEVQLVDRTCEKYNEVKPNVKSTFLNEINKRNFTYYSGQGENHECSKVTKLLSQREETRVIVNPNTVPEICTNEILRRRYLIHDRTDIDAMLEKMAWMNRNNNDLSHSMTKLNQGDLWNTGSLANKRIHLFHT